VKDDGNDSQYQKNVDKERRDVEHEKSSQPQQKQQESNRKKHGFPLSTLSVS
jgi:hypothetical protein